METQKGSDILFAADQDVVYRTFQVSPSLQQVVWGILRKCLKATTSTFILFLFLRLLLPSLFSSKLI